ncbi:MAG: hypothetical protein QOJ55_1708 [Solirubrobacteraceae bacterium]|nr:hypothetical protein [Solirubrobacteraceae bacterium]
MKPRLVTLAVLGASALSACGQAHSASRAATQAAPSPPPAPSTGLAGNGSFSQAATICRGFVGHVNRDLPHGIRALHPALASSLFGELEALSRRIQFLRAPAGRRADAAHWAADLDRAASIANELGGADITSAAGRTRFLATLGRERTALERANADALRLGLRGCRIAVGP